MNSAYFSILLLLFAAVVLEAANPIITDAFTADPAVVVYEDTLYLYTSHDEAAPDEQAYVMRDWLGFSTTDMVNWTAHGALLASEDFVWADNHAYAGHVVERDGTFYWYVPMGWRDGTGFAIGVATADSPTGPFKDALGRPLITSDMTPDPKGREGQRITWDDIDPAVFIDDDGQGYIFWGNTQLKWAKLTADLLELDGEIHYLEVPAFEEGPWVHKRGERYYLSYSSGFPERIAYATAPAITGPWTYQGIIQGLTANSSTNHHAIVEFKDRSYFFYHDGGLPTGGSYRRSVCVDYLQYDVRGRILPVQPTLEGVVAVDAPLPVSVGGEKETWVFVHGAWAGAWEWQRLGRLLEAEGKRVYRPTHTGNGERHHLSNPEINLETHIIDVVNVLEWEDLTDVILVGHSYGGMVITGVVDRVSERIGHVIYLDAALPEDGQSMMDTFKSAGPSPWTEPFAYPGSHYDSEATKPHIVPQSTASFSTPIQLRNQATALERPTTYLLTVDDPAAPEADGFFPSYQEAEKRGWQTRIMHASHIPHVDQAENLAALLLDLVEGR